MEIEGEGRRRFNIGGKKNRWRMMRIDGTEGEEEGKGSGW